MPHRDQAPIGAPCWTDLLTTDKAKAVAFYTELFGWTAEDMGPDYGGYVNFSKDGVRVAGCMANTGQSPMPDFWATYLAVADANATVDQAVARGSAVIVPAMDVMQLGVMGVVTDPGNAGIGMWQSKDHRGFGVYAEPDTPSWFELHTRAYEESVDFYRDVFAWKAHTAADEPGFRYTTLGEGDDALAGIMDASGFLPEGMHGTWFVYFGTADADKTLDRVTDLGGAVVMKAEDTPYGRLATAADPTGAVFKLHQPI